MVNQRFPPKRTNHSMCTAMTDGNHTVSSMVIVHRVQTGSQAAITF